MIRLGREIDFAHIWCIMLTRKGMCQLLIPSQPAVGLLSPYGLKLIRPVRVCRAKAMKLWHQVYGTAKHI